MGGREHWSLPKVGRQHTIDVDGERWEICPPFDGVLMVNYASDEAGVQVGAELNDKQLAIVKRACVDHMLTEDQRAAFWKWPSERQGMMAEKLFLIWNEMRSGKDHGNPDDPAPVVEEPATGPDPTESPSA
jgi:hypothetical protein